MTTRMTRAATRSMDTALAPVAEEEQCTICLEPLVHASRVSLPCGHNTFCGQCLVTHLLRDVRCPICRQGDDSSEDASVISDDDEEDLQRIQAEKAAYKRAMKKARDAANSGRDRRAKTSIDKINQWKKKATESKKMWKDKAEELRIAERYMMDQLRLHEIRLEREFDDNYGSLEQEVKKLKAESRRARGRAKQIEGMLAKRFLEAPQPASQ